MLPSTGLFKAINCPYYDAGTCLRPYCHFRHTKKGNLLFSLRTFLILTGSFRTIEFRQ